MCVRVSSTHLSLSSFSQLGHGGINGVGLSRKVVARSLVLSLRERTEEKLKGTAAGSRSALAEAFRSYRLMPNFVSPEKRGGREIRERAKGYGTRAKEIMYVFVRR